MTTLTHDELWESPRLLVPIAVEALVVNNVDQRHTQWAINPNRYSGLDKYEPVSPPPFARNWQRSRVGITLHWALPDALTRGDIAANTSMNFPVVPNRWLIIRAHTTPGSELSYRGWVVESDFKGNEGKNPYPEADRTVTRIGRHHDLENWSEEDDLAAPFLTAMGPGDMTFAAYVAHNDDVFSFHDDLDDAAVFPDQGRESDGRARGATFSYLVFGWYAGGGEGRMAHMEADPMSGWATVAVWQTLLQKYRWSLGGDQGDIDRAIEAAVAVLGRNDGDPPDRKYPSQILCHGLVYDVKWSGLDGIPQSGVPKIDRNPQEVVRQDGPTWIVQEGDTLESISLAMYGSEAGAARIAARNGLSSDELTVGMELTIPRRKTDVPHVAIGNSSSEALAAMVEYLMDSSATVEGSEDVAALMQAAEHGLLETYDQPGGRITLDQAIHKDWFASAPGGLRWQLVAPRRMEPNHANGDLVNGAELEPWTMTCGQRTKLDALNAAQQELETAMRELHKARRRLYDVWWKLTRFPHVARPLAGWEGLKEPFKERFKKDLDESTFKEELENAKVAEARAAFRALELVNRWKSRVETGKEALEAELDKTSPEERPELIGRELPRYWEAADPVVVIFGGQRSTKHGNDGRFRPDNTLFCRISGQSVAELEIAAGRSASAEVVRSIPALANLLGQLANPAIPQRDISALIVESLLLDPTLATVVAGQVNKNDHAQAAADAETLKNKQRLLWSQVPGAAVDERSLAAAAGIKGHGLIPSPHGVAEWRPPWSPLFLSWQATWYPTSHDPAGALESWHFNPFDGLEYDWRGSGLPDHDDVLTISGRSVLTDTRLDRLMKNLEESLLARREEGKATPLLAKLNLMQDQLKSADLLSQSMTGFHDRLIMRNRGQGFLPPEEETVTVRNAGDAAVEERLRDLIGDIERSAPIPFANGAEGSHFYPLRAGHLRINRLWIIDSFGQIFDPIRARGLTPASFVPLRGGGLTTVGPRQRGDSQVLQLPPRLLQPSRLWFDFIPASQETDVPAPPAGSEAAAAGACLRPISEEDQVLGWLLPNHHDHSLAIYDQSGGFLGTLMTLTQEGVELLGWAGAPDGAPVAAAQALAANRALNRLVGGRFAGEDSVAAFAAFMREISPESLNPVHGWLLPNHYDRSLAVYDQSGAFLGALMTMMQGGVEVLGWAAADDMSLRAERPALADGTLDALIAGLFARADSADSAAAFDDFMNAIDRTLWTIDPLGERRNANVSMLVGRPIAVAKAGLRLETLGDGAVDQLWGKTFDGDHNVLAGLRFKVQLGDVMLRQDGALGYYADNNYDRFHSVHPELELDTGYVSNEVALLELELNASADREVTLLLDPRGVVHARSGILPTGAISLPPGALEGALARMDVTFRVGPLLSDADKVRMPLPAELHGSWSWIEKSGVNLTPHAIEPFQVIAELDDDPPIIREGWLKLSDGLADGED